MRRDFRLFLRIALRITSQQIIIGRTHLEQGGFCLETGVELPRELNIHFLVNENGDLYFFSTFKMSSNALPLE